MQQFENARIGIDKVFKAEILSLIAEVSLVLAGAFGVIALASNGAAGVIASLGGAVILVLVALVLGIISIVKNIKGLNIAKQDDDGYKQALSFIIALLVIQVVEGICSGFSVPSWVSSGLQGADFIANIFFFGYTIKATERLLIKRDKTSIAQKGNTIIILAAISFAVALIARIVGSAFGHLTLVVIISAIVSVLAMVIAYVVYLVFLNQARKNLAD